MVNCAFTLIALPFGLGACELPPENWTVTEATICSLLVSKNKEDRTCRNAETMMRHSRDAWRWMR